MYSMNNGTVEFRSTGSEITGLPEKNGFVGHWHTDSLTLLPYNALEYLYDHAFYK